MKRAEDDCTINRAWFALGYSNQNNGPGATTLEQGTGAEIVPSVSCTSPHTYMMEVIETYGLSASPRVPVVLLALISFSPLVHAAVWRLEGPCFCVHLKPFIVDLESSHAELL